MKKISALAAISAVAALTLTLNLFTMEAAAQTEKFDIASFTPPKGWQRLDSNNILIFYHSKTVGNGTAFCQIVLMPSRASNNTPMKNFDDDWANLVTRTTGNTSKPTTETEKTPDGWTAIKGYGNITQQGGTYTCIVVSISGFGKVMTLLINLAGQEYVSAVDDFLKSFELDSKANAGTNTQPGAIANFNWSNYSFIAPERWQTMQTNQYIMLAQSQNAVNHGCVITILPPMQSSGNLETDARAILGQMYPGWSYRYTGEKKEDMSKGFTPQGLEYCMIEAPMHRQRPDGYYYDYEDGSVWVIGLSGKQITVITGRHNREIACFCFHQYEYWRRFFNSFTVKGQEPAKGAEQDAAKRILGDWMALGATALTEYIFAANGNYQFIGAGGTTSRTSDAYYEYIYLKVSSFTGDGSYSIKNGNIIFKDRGDSKTEQVPFRFEMVNHGGTGWKERLYMRKIGLSDGKEYEVCYEKRR